MDSRFVIDHTSFILARRGWCQTCLAQLLFGSFVVCGIGDCVTQGAGGCKCRHGLGLHNATCHGKC